MTLIERGEIDPGGRRVAYCDRVFELLFGGGVVSIFFGEHGAQAVGVHGEAGFDAGDEGLRLVGAAADDGRRADVVLAEIAGGARRLGVQLNGTLELVAHFSGEGEGCDGIGVRGLHPVGAAEPEVVVAAGGVVVDSEFALVDGEVGHVLRVEDAAEELMGESVVGLGGEVGPEDGGGVVNAALLQCDVCAGRAWAVAVGLCTRAGEEQEQKQGGTEQVTREDSLGHGYSTVLTASPFVRSRLLVALRATVSFSVRPLVISTQSPERPALVTRVRLTAPN